MSKEKIKVFVVGLDPYPGNNGYGPLQVEGYCFPTVAFIPKLNNRQEHKDSELKRLYNITAYRRVMSFLEGRALTIVDFNKYSNVERVVNNFKDNGIYFGNINEIEISKIKHKLDEDPLVILFGVATKAEWEKQIKDTDSGLNAEVVFFHHPSPQVHHTDWKKYDSKMQNNISPEEIEKDIKDKMPVVHDLVKGMSF